MSKNFEEEYRHMIEEDIPDLWDRIEAQLPNDVGVIEASDQQPYEQLYIKSYKQPDKKKHFFQGRSFAWGSFAAAVFAIFVIMPVLVMISAKRGGDATAPMDESYNNSPTMESQSIGGMYDTADSSYESAPSMDTGYSYNGTGADYAPEPADSLNDFDYDGFDEMLEGEYEAEAIQGTQTDNSEVVNNSIENNSGGKETDMPESGILESVVEESTDFYQADVKILSVIPTDRGVTLYEAEILDGSHESWDSDWREGARLFLMFDDEDETGNGSSGHTVRVGRCYTLSLYSSGEVVDSYGIGVSQPENSESSVYRIGVYIISAVEKQAMP